MSTPITRRGMTAAEVATYTGLDVRTIYDVADEIGCARAGRAIRFHPEAVDAWLKGHRRGGDLNATHSHTAGVR